MLKQKVLLGFAVVSLLLSACTTSAVVEQQDKAEQQDEAVQIQASEPAHLTVMRSAKPADVLPAFTTFTWETQYSQVLASSANKNKGAVSAYIKSEIIKYLATKGYQYQAQREQADVVIGFLLALENDNANQNIENKFGLLPKSHANNLNALRYQKGDFLVTLLDVHLNVVYWRAAMQGFSDLESLQENNNSQKMQWILGLMMGDFPKAGR